MEYAPHLDPAWDPYAAVFNVCFSPRIEEPSSPNSSGIRIWPKCYPSGLCCSCSLELIGQAMVMPCVGRNDLADVVMSVFASYQYRRILYCRRQSQCTVINLSPRSKLKSKGFFNSVLKCLSRRCPVHYITGINLLRAHFRRTFSALLLPRCLPSRLVCSFTFRFMYRTTKWNKWPPPVFLEYILPYRRPVTFAQGSSSRMICGRNLQRHVLRRLVARDCSCEWWVHN